MKKMVWTYQKTEEVLYRDLLGYIRRGRPQVRWKQVEDDLRGLGVTRWTEVAFGRKEKKISQKP